MKNVCSYLIIFSLIGAACSTPTSTRPTPMAGATASTQISGISPIPSGMFLFVEFRVQVERRRGCDNEYIDFPTYSYIRGTLQLQEKLIKSPHELDTIKGFFGREQSLTGEAGSGMYSELQVIPTFPYIDTVLPNWHFEQHPSVNIIGASSLGEIEVEIEGQTLNLQPGESWQKQVENDPAFGCHVVTTRRFTNHGLLNKSQIKF